VYGWSGCSKTFRTDPTPARVHHRDAVRDVLHGRDVVRDQEIREALLFLEGHQSVQNLGLDRHVERARRLVQHDQSGREAEGAGEGDPLASPPRELVRVLVETILRQADHRKDLRDAFSERALRDLLLGFDRFPDDLPDPHARVE
jgi:hypothetical protein